MKFGTANGDSCLVLAVRRDGHFRIFFCQLRISNRSIDSEPECFFVEYFRIFLSKTDPESQLQIFIKLRSNKKQKHTNNYKLVASPRAVSTHVTHFSLQPIKTSSSRIVCVCTRQHARIITVLRRCSSRKVLNRILMWILLGFESSCIDS